MNKIEFVKAVAARANVTEKEAAVVTNAVLNEIMEAVAKGETVTFVGFGSFGTKTIPARTGEFRGKKYVTKAHPAPAFHAGKAFKDKVE